MTDSTEPAGEAVPKPITLSAVAEEMAAEADFHRNRKLLRAAQVDELAAQVSRLTRAIEEIDGEFSRKKAKMALQPDYTTGTITLTSGSVNFTTSGAALQTAAIQAGDQILLPAKGLVLTIASITGQNSGTLTDNCPAAAVGAAQGYRIRYQSDLARVASATRDLLLRLDNGKLDALASLTLANNKGIYATGANSLATYDLTAFARTLLDDASAAAMRLTLEANNAGNLNTGTLPAARLPFETGVSELTLTATTTPPTVSAYAARNCRWMKLGQLVLAAIDIRPTITNIGAGSVQITGMPFGSTGGLFTVPGSVGLNTMTNAAVTVDISATGGVRLLNSPGAQAPVSVLQTGSATFFIASLIYTTAS